MRSSLSLLAAALISLHGCGDDARKPGGGTAGAGASSGTAGSSGGTAGSSGGTAGSSGGTAGSSGGTAGSSGGTAGSSGGGAAGMPDFGGSFRGGDGSESATLTIAGARRDVEVYAPPGRPASPPLLIVLHGTYGRGPEMVSADRPRGFENLADRVGVVLAAPTARELTAGDWDQHAEGEANRTYWETLPTDDPARGTDPARNPDLALLRAIVAEAQRVHHTDPRRTYVLGFSNGGFFALHAAVVLRAQIAGFGEVASGLVRCENTNSCQFRGSGTTCEALRGEADYCTCSGSEKPTALPTSGRMPPGYLTHSNDDDTVSVYYTCELAARMTALGHKVEVRIQDRAGGHVIPDSLAEDAWAFFSQLPPS